MDSAENDPISFFMKYHSDDEAGGKAAANCRFLEFFPFRLFSLTALFPQRPAIVNCWQPHNSPIGGRPR
ncbi:hypothetical protein [Holdemania massiliensis]|uniref:hypothetical protein n=1 Tax=Holdemania massiliensis TaxID=1468449 RepID=UPI0019D4FF5D|nr:hypothetical protein [Holdemania massiliensis]